ncbi:MAG: hypothetical protein INR69_15825 [Mucilaginibacter polytrichastri]|nr:hypothetical protein [Mucilaginibacter polytrichastri]
MIRPKRAFFGILFFTGFFFARTVSAQNSAAGFPKEMRQLEDSLITLGKTLVNNENDVERKNANYQFIRTLVKALSTPNSYAYPFDSLRSLSILKSPDNKFRIFSWHVMNQDGSYRFYGSIQFNTPQLKLLPLEDYSAFMKNPEDTVTSNRKWLGAQYYTIIPVADRNPYYVLLGWKGNNVRTTKKVIEVLSFDAKGEPVFGRDVFAGGEKGPRKRVVFEYTRNASMLLRYVPVKNMIVFDHIASSNSKDKTNPEFAGPDMSYDGYQLKSGKWTLVSDLDLRNMPTGNEDQYNDPRLMKNAPQETEKL